MSKSKIKNSIDAIKPERREKSNGQPDINIRQIVDDSGHTYLNRVLIGTACTGLMRTEWVGARYSATLPVNWSQVEMTHQIPTYMPLRYQVADAQNMIVKQAVTKDFEWLLLLEHDVVIQADTFTRFNNWMLSEQAPIISGLYFSRSHPSQPLIFRGRGNGVYLDWQQGDIVYCDGVPTGLLLIHVGILKLMWEDCPEYALWGTTTRRVFVTPREMWYNPNDAAVSVGRRSGTSDLDWCSRVIEGDYIRKAGWEDYWDNLEDKQYPMICDTGIFARHINPDGEMFP